MVAFAWFIVLGMVIVLLTALIIFFLIFRRREETPQQLPDVDEIIFDVEASDIYRENLADSFSDQTLWNCSVCSFHNNPAKRRCDLCQTPRGIDQGTFKLLQQLHQRDLKNPNSKSHVEKNNSLPVPTFPLSKLQIAASRRKQWKRMPGADGLHRWVRDTHKPQLNNNRDAVDIILGDYPTDRNSERESTTSINSIGYIRVRDSNGKLVLNESDTVATDFHYKINMAGTDVVMNLEELTVLPFAQKIKWFSTEIHRLWFPWESGHVDMDIRRDHVLEDSFRQVMLLKPHQMRQRWRVTFVGEPALDAGGVLREWLMLLCGELFSQSLGLFVPTVGEETSYWINVGSSMILEDHLEYFTFAGRILGKALLEEQLIQVHLALPLLKHMLGVPISFTDLQFLDDELYRSLLWLKRSTDPEAIAALCLDFTVTRKVENGVQVVPLAPNGDQIDVTLVNKAAYIDLLFQYHMLDSVSIQLLTLLASLYSVVPEGLLKLFDYQELELLLCGVPSIDVEDWQRHSEVKYVTPLVPTEIELLNCRWFWATVVNMAPQEQARLLQFVTGSSRVPAQGFKALISSDGRVQPFNIAFCGPDIGSMYPRAHTCFNRLDLPVYQSKEQMEKYLILIVNMDITGFTIE
ncbi:HECT E3 ubiquitin ligase [Thraustotheca clavata]|uniref:HECT-type E3 ubiquitin transferase n=1 Tax=Thraustotheca clavata TaxID=74557 RepID=A0A1V9YVY0_9STRA|nr:HECT E3 ubiquitin ligase [Thraustotheca clavata]